MAVRALCWALLITASAVLPICSMLSVVVATIEKPPHSGRVQLSYMYTLHIEDLNIRESGSAIG